MPKTTVRKDTLKAIDDAIYGLALQQSVVASGSSEMEELQEEDEELLALCHGIKEHCYLNPHRSIPKLHEMADYFRRWPNQEFRQIVRVNKRTFNMLLSKVEHHPVFHGNSSNKQKPVWLQLACALE